MITINTDDYHIGSDMPIGIGKCPPLTIGHKSQSVWSQSPDNSQIHTKHPAYTTVHCTTNVQLCTMYIGNSRHEDHTAIDCVMTHSLDGG